MGQRQKYLGVTSDLVKRIHEHREGLIEGFTSRYGVTRLVYYETYDDIETAITREKALKRFRRQWKIGLVEESDPDWRDLWPEIAGSVEQRKF